MKIQGGRAPPRLRYSQVRVQEHPLSRRLLKPGAVFNTRFMDRRKVGDFFLRTPRDAGHLPTRINAQEALNRHSPCADFACAAIIDEQPAQELRLRATLRDYFKSTLGTSDT